jgi:hypothetical protein
MKKRFLPLGFFVLTLGLSFLIASAFIYVGDAPSGKIGSASEYLAKLRNNQVTGQLSPRDVLLAREQVQQNEMMRSGRGLDLPWNLAGPNNMGGRTRALLFDNQDPTGATMYAGSVLGGIFLSDNGGYDWTRISLGSGNLHVTCLAQTADGSIYLGTGEGFTVEKYTVLEPWGYTSGLIGQGIFKSTDGENFTLLTATKPFVNGSDELEWGYINELAADQTSGRIYAATNSGLKCSSDGGSSWSVAVADDTLQLETVSKDVKIGSNGLVIAEVNNLCYISENGDPNNFTQVSGDSTWNLPATGVGRVEFTIAPTNPDIFYSLVLNASGALVNVYRTEDKGATWRVVGPGGSTNFNVFNTGNNIGAGIGLYAATIEVFPTDADRILIGGINMWEGKKVDENGYFDWQMRSDGSTFFLDQTYLHKNHHIFKFVPGTSQNCYIGTNGGVSQGNLSQNQFVFQSLNKNYTSSQFYAVSYSMNKMDLLGGSQDLGSVYIAGTVNASDPKRGYDIWTNTAGIPDGATGTYCAKSIIFPEMAIYSRYPHPAKDGSIETFVRRNEYGGGTDWADPERTFPDRAAPLEDYASTAYLSPFVLWESFEDYNSRDSIPFKAYQDYPAGSVVAMNSENANRIFFHTFPQGLTKGDSLQVQDIIASKFFIGGDDMVMLTKEFLKYDRDPEWYTIANETTGFTGKPQCMAYSADANHLFVGTLEGQLYRLSNITYAWNFERADVGSAYCVIATSRIPIYLPETTTEITQVVTSVAVNPNNANEVIITLGNYGNEHYVYMTTNALAANPTFHSIQGDPNNGGLPQMPAYSSLFEMNSQNHLVMVGTEHGIYVSENVNSSQPTWTAENNTIGGVPVFMLKQQTLRKDNDTIYAPDQTMTVIKGVDNYGVIYGATYGRGLIRLDEFQKPVGIFNPGSSHGTGPDFNVYPNPADDKTRVEFTLTTSCKVSFDLYDLSGKVVRSTDEGHLPTGRHEVTLTVGDLTPGTYLLRITAGSNSSAGKIIIY